MGRRTPSCLVSSCRDSLSSVDCNSPARAVESQHLSTLPKARSSGSDRRRAASALPGLDLHLICAGDEPKRRSNLATEQRDLSLEPHERTTQTREARARCGPDRGESLPRRARWWTWRWPRTGSDMPSISAIQESYPPCSLAAVVRSQMPLDGGGGGYGDSLTGTNVRVMLLALRTQVYPVPPLAHPACFVRMVAVG